MHDYSDCIFSKCPSQRPFEQITMQREEERAIGPMFFFRYIGALLRHYEEGFWLILLVVLNSIPGIKHLATISGIVRWAEQRAASVAMCGNYRAHDVALSLLRMVSNNIGHIACMCAQQHKLPHIVFGGSFIRDHPYTIATISSGVRFYSRGAVQALYLRHDGFVGAVGAHVAGLDDGRSVIQTVQRIPEGAEKLRPPREWTEPEAATATFAAAVPSSTQTAPGPALAAAAAETAERAAWETRLQEEVAKRRSVELELEELRAQVQGGVTSARGDLAPT